MKLFFENKKLRGLGYSVLRKQNTGRFTAFYLLSPWQNLKVYFYNGVCQRDSVTKGRLERPGGISPPKILIFYMFQAGESSRQIRRRRKLRVL